MRLTLHVDGGSRGNPGPAGAGVDITDDKGKPVYEAGFHLEPMTNNQAEYHGLLLGLREARRLGATGLDVLADSELLVRQINGQYKVKNDALKPLHARAVAALREIGSWRMTHVRREGNARADELANLAMDAGEDVVVLDRSGQGEPARDHSAGRSRTDQPSGNRIRPLRAKCVAAPNAKICAAPCAAGTEFLFAGTVPAGVCILSAPELLSAVRIVGRTDESMVVDCPESGCGGRFEVGGG